MFSRAPGTFLFLVKVWVLDQYLIFLIQIPRLCSEQINNYIGLFGDFQGAASLWGLERIELSLFRNLIGRIGTSVDNIQQRAGMQNRKQSDKINLGIISNISESQHSQCGEKGKYEDMNSPPDMNLFQNKLRLYSQYLNNESAPAEQSGTLEQIRKDQPQHEGIEDGSDETPLKKQMKKVMEKVLRFQNKLFQFDMKCNINAPNI